MRGRAPVTAQGGSVQLVLPRNRHSCCTEDQNDWSLTHAAESEDPTKSPLRPDSTRRRLPEGSVTFLDQDTTALHLDRHRSSTRGSRRPRWGPANSGGWQSPQAAPLESPPLSRHPLSHENLYRQVSVSSDDSESCGWSTETSTDSGNEASVSMQLSMLHEATRWFPHTDFYAKMKASAQPQVDKKQVYNDPVTGRLRIGGSIFSLLLFMCFTQRQSSLEDIPLIALQLGGVRFVVWALVLTCICSLPIMITDVALGQTTQGSVLKALNGLDQRLRGLGLAMAICGTVFAIAQSYVSSLVLHFIATSYGAMSQLMNKDTVHRACVPLSIADCTADPRCALAVDGRCLPALETYINASWMHFLTSTDTGMKISSIVGCLAIWLIITYVAIQAPRALGALGACVFPCMFLLLPALVLMEVTFVDQKYGMGDLLSIPWQPKSSQELYYSVLIIPLLVYMPGDGAVMTIASYDKLSHNPIVLSVACLCAKWFVSYMLLHIMFFAEGMAPDRLLFKRMFLPTSLHWVTAGGPGSAAFPVLCYAVARMWPTSWLLGVLSLLAISIQRFASCWAYMMVQWAVLQEMRWLKAPPRAQKPAPLQRGLPLPSLRAQAQEEFENPGPQLQDEKDQSDEGLHDVRVSRSSFSMEAGAVPDVRQRCARFRGTSMLFDVRRSIHTHETMSSSGDEESRPGFFPRVLRLLRITADPYEDEDDDKALPAQEMLLDAKPDAAGDAPLSWWGGPESQGHEKFRQGDGDASDIRINKLLLAAIVYGPPAALSALLICFCLPMEKTDDVRFRAPLHYNMILHADVFLRLLLGGTKCVHVAWIFGSREQVQRVGLLPLLVLGCGVVASMSMPFFRTILSIDVSLSAFLMFMLPLGFIVLAALIVAIQTALNLREILEQGKGPARRRRSGKGDLIHRGLQRAGARSLSLSRRPYCNAFLPPEASSAGTSTDDRFLNEVRRSSLERSIGRPVLQGRLPLNRNPYKKTHKTVEQRKRRKSAEGVVRKGSRARRIAYVTNLFVRLLKSNLYWAFIGNIEILRANLNIALSGSPSKPLPMIWGWLLKFVATPWLLADFMEHVVHTIPMVFAQLEGTQTPLAYLLLGWVLLIVCIMLYGKE